MLTRTAPSTRAVFCLLTCFSLLSLLLSLHLTHNKALESGTSSSTRPRQQRGILSRSNGDPEAITGGGGVPPAAAILLPPSAPRPTPPLLARLRKLESALLSEVAKRPPTVLVRGQKLLVTRDLPTYAKAVKQQGSKAVSGLQLLDTTIERVRMVHVNNSVYYAKEEEAVGGGRVMAYDWRLLLCFTYTDGDSAACLSRGLFPRLAPGQKVGRYPGVRGSLWRRESLCSFVQSTRLVGSVRALIPPCYALPQHLDALIAAAHALPDHHTWVIKNPGGSSRPITVIDNKKLLDQIKDKRVGAGQVIQTHWSPPLEVLGAMISVRLYVVVTALQPLRCHIHSYGEVTFRHPPSRGYHKIPGRWWTWSELVQWVGHTHGEEIMQDMVGRTEAALVTLALIMDLILPPKFPHARRKEDKRSRSFRCDSCFQLLAVELVYNSTFHPTIIEVNGQPDLSSQDPYKDTLGPQQWRETLPSAGRTQVAQDLLDLLNKEENVAEDVHEMFSEAMDNTGVVGIDCLISHEMCLTDADLKYIMDTKREARFQISTKDYTINNEYANKKSDASVGLKSFEMYVNNEKSKMKNFYENETSFENNNVLNKVDYNVDDEPIFEKEVNLRDTDKIYNMNLQLDNRNDGFIMIYPTPIGHQYDQIIYDLYQSVTSNTSATFAPAGYLLLESWRHVTRDIHTVLTALEAHQHALPPKVSPLLNGLVFSKYENVHSVWLEQQQQQQQRDGKSCMEDPATSPYLQRLELIPSLSLTPTFTPLVTTYWAEVDYHLITLKVAGIALNCHAEARLDDKYGPSVLVNTTLGLGDNRVTLLVVDIGHSEPWTLNTYTIHIRRRPPPLPSPPIINRQHQVCQLKQECDLLISPREPCGLQKEPSQSSWLALQNHRRTLPSCTTGDAPGRWVLPCGSCGLRRDCDWSQAVWQPVACTHRQIPTAGLQRCLRRKTVVFLGDSTNRGMLYALLERINGTLSSWDKTHDVRVIRDANGGDTTFAFAYYPKFWLPSDQRPGFDKTLHNLLLRSGPLHNSSATVIVVGGVHWIAAQHLRMINQVLEREGLQGAHVVLKTLGAGFHVAQPGVHTISKEEHSRLLEHSQGVASYGHQLGYSVVDTFNMTTARFQHFRQGKCACHFHQVMKESDGMGGHRYRVEGEINAIYTDILANTICPEYVPHR